MSEVEERPRPVKVGNGLKKGVLEKTPSDL